MHAAPWDYDLAYNFDCYYGYLTSIETGEVQDYASGWNVKNGRTFAEWIDADGNPQHGRIHFGRNIRVLFYHLFKHPEFQVVFRRLYRRARSGPLSDWRQLVSSLSQSITASARRDIQLWSHTSNRCAFWECCHPEDTHSAEESQKHLLSYLEDRSKWMDENIDRPF